MKRRDDILVLIKAWRGAGDVLEVEGVGLL